MPEGEVVHEGEGEGEGGGEVLGGVEDDGAGGLLSQPIPSPSES